MCSIYGTKLMIRTSQMLANYHHYNFVYLLYNQNKLLENKDQI